MRPRWRWRLVREDAQHFARHAQVHRAFRLAHRHVERASRQVARAAHSRQALDREHAVLLEQGVQVARLALGHALEIFLDQIVAAKEEGGAITQRDRHRAALEVIAERIADLGEGREVGDVGTAAERARIAVAPSAVATLPGRGQIAPVGEIGAAGDAVAVGPAGAELRTPEESVVADLVIGIDLQAVELALVAHLIVDQEPVISKVGIGEIFGRRTAGARAKELNDRSLAAIVDRDIGEGLHRTDQPVLAAGRGDSLSLHIEAEAIGREEFWGPDV